jgi:plasmid stabilization system protein ParE
MADDKTAIDKENPVFSVKVSLKYEKNLQVALDYSFQNWGAVTMVNFYLEVIKEIDKLVFFPYSNRPNRFLDDINYREIILRKYPYVITYCINKDIIKIINIIHTNKNPIRRKAKH